MSETTTRPWEIRQDNMGSWWVADMSERRVCYVGHESDARAEGDARLIVEAVNHRQLILDALDGSAAHLETIHDAADSDDPWIVDLYATVQAALAAVRGLEATP